MSNSLLRTALASAALCLCAAPAGAQLFGLPIPNIFKNNGGTDANRNAGPQQEQGAVRQEAEAFAAKHEPWAQPLMKALYLDGEWGAVLNFERLGLAAMENQKFELAKRAFDQAITQREALGQVQVSEIRAIPSVTIEEAELRGRTAMITVRIVSDQISLMRDQAGAPVVGTDALTEITDLWTFERDLGQPDPTWRLVAARSA